MSKTRNSSRPSPPSSEPEANPDSLVPGQSDLADLHSPAFLGELRLLFRSPHWEALRRLLHRERGFLVEGLIRSSEPVADARRRIIIQWIDYLLDPERGIARDLYEAEAIRKLGETVIDSDAMPLDTSDPETPTEEDYDQ